MWAIIIVSVAVDVVVMVIVHRTSWGGESDTPK